MRTIYVSATRAKSFNDTLLGKCFVEQAEYYGRSQELHMKPENTDKLASVYNEFITPEYRDCIVVFVHDDVTLDVMATTRELQAALKDNDIIGLAGCTTAKIERPMLWHLSAPRQNLSGAVAHPAAKDSPHIFMSSFGPYPQRCLLMDGLFLAVKINSLLLSGVRFDESNPAVAHFYDLDFCLAANAAGLKMSTWQIYVTHRSPGLLSVDDPTWKTGQEWFMNKWNKGSKQ